MPKIDIKSARSKRPQAEIIKDLVKEEKIEEDLISLYSTMLETGIAKCLEPDLIDTFNMNLTTLKDESIIHRKMVSVILNKFNN